MPGKESFPLWCSQIPNIVWSTCTQLKVRIRKHSVLSWMNYWSFEMFCRIQYISIKLYVSKFRGVTRVSPISWRKWMKFSAIFLHFECNFNSPVHRSDHQHQSRLSTSSFLGMKSETQSKDLAPLKHICFSRFAKFWGKSLSELVLKAIRMGTMLILHFFLSWTNQDEVTEINEMVFCYFTRTTDIAELGELGRKTRWGW